MINIHSCRLEEYLGNANKKKLIVVCDEKLLRLHKNRFSSFNTVPVKAGEKAKTLQAISSLYRTFLKNGIDRDSFIIGVGGGCITDVAGFAASTFMRGVPFAFVPTTLLALVDASMGGKNGVNFMNYKNIVGTFNQPLFLIHDFSFLSTLKDNDIMCGLAEVIKHALIADVELFSFLKSNIHAVKKMETVALKRIVDDSVRIKMGVVERDEKESGERKILNFGHTFGHAIENVLNIDHGKAVSKGMYFSLKLSHKMNILSESEMKDAISILDSYGYKDFKISKPKMKEAVDALRKDKKKSNDVINFILLDKIGHAVIKKIEIKILEGILYDLC